MDEPEIIKILRREEMLRKREEKPHEIFQESELSNNISRCDFEVDIPQKDILSEKTLGIKDQEFHTRLIEDNDDTTVEKESASQQKAQQDIKLERSEELQTPRTEKTIEQPRSLLEKARHRKQEIIRSGKQHKKLQLKDKEKGDEQTGFGWRGLGSRRIVFDNDLKEYVYDVMEPQLKKEKEKIKEREPITQDTL